MTRAWGSDSLRDQFAAGAILRMWPGQLLLNDQSID